MFHAVAMLPAASRSPSDLMAVQFSPVWCSRSMNSASCDPIAHDRDDRVHHLAPSVDRQLLWNLAPHTTFRSPRS